MEWSRIFHFDQEQKYSLEKAETACTNYVDYVEDMFGSQLVDVPRIADPSESQLVDVPRTINSCNSTIRKSDGGNLKIHVNQLL